MAGPGVNAAGYSLAEATIETGEPSPRIMATGSHRARTGRPGALCVQPDTDASQARHPQPRNGRPGGRSPLARSVTDAYKQTISDGGGHLQLLWVFNFPAGLTGVHILTGHWYAPCGDANVP